MDYKYKIFIPYRICLLGSHIDHQLGNTIGCVINKGITLYYNPYNKIEVYSEHFNSTFKCYYFDNLIYNLQNLNYKIEIYKMRVIEYHYKNEEKFFFIFLFTFIFLYNIINKKYCKG